MSTFTNTFIEFGELSAAVSFNAATGSDEFFPDNADGRVNLVIKNANTQSATVTLKAGDGPLASLGDVAITAAGGQTVFVPLSRVETARVKLITGTNKGKILVTTTVETGGTVGNVSIGIVSVE